MNVLKKGGKVLLTAAGKVTYGKEVVQQFTPVFWNTSWFKMRPPHTTGSYIQNEHPIFRDFPTEDWQNLNWWELVNKTQVINMSHFPMDFQPIVQPIDTWHISRKLGMLFEAQVAGGKLVMTTMDLSSDLDKRLGGGSGAIVRIADSYMIDDHWPFIEQGIPAIDLVDFDYGPRPGALAYWHNEADTLDKLSPKSLGTTGRLLLEVLAHIDERETKTARE